MSEPHGRVEWMHPVRGRIAEVVCTRHERELLGALRVVGIGCVGRLAREGEGGCIRCAHDGQPFRAFADEAASP